MANSAETGGSIRRGLIIGLVGILVVLSFRFRIYVVPLVVMLTIPLALLGAVWGRVLMGYLLSMPSLIGATSLAGIVVNNAILLIEFITHHRGAGAQRRSLCRAGQPRSAAGQPDLLGHHQHRPGAPARGDQHPGGIRQAPGDLRGVRTAERHRAGGPGDPSPLRATRRLGLGAGPGVAGADTIAGRAPLGQRLSPETTPEKTVCGSLSHTAGGQRPVIQ